MDENTNFQEGYYSPDKFIPLSDMDYQEGEAISYPYVFMRNHYICCYVQGWVFTYYLDITDESVIFGSSTSLEKHTIKIEDSYKNYLMSSIESKTNLEIGRFLLKEMQKLVEFKEDMDEVRVISSDEIPAMVPTKSARKI